MSDQTTDQRVAEKLRISPDQVRAARDEWNVSQNAVMIREIFSDRLKRQIDERMNKLKTAEFVRGIQGEIQALELALSLTTQHPLNNE